MKIKKIFQGTLFFVFAVSFFSCVSVKKEPEPIKEYTYGQSGEGSVIKLVFEKGKEHNHPLFAVWLADSAGKFLQTLYVSESIGKGVFRHANRTAGHWLAGEIKRPASLPYWMHQRNVKNECGDLLPTPKQPVADAYTGATPLTSFVLRLKTDKPLDGTYRLFLELNQSWDWNEYWTNNKFPGDSEYKTSSQPALVYAADLDTRAPAEVELKPIGHSHYSGKDGKLYTDLNTLTTALKIARKITVSMEKTK